MLGRRAVACATQSLRRSWAETRAMTYDLTKHSVGGGQLRLWGMLVCGEIKVAHWAGLFSKIIVWPIEWRDRLMPPAILPLRVQRRVSKGQRSTFVGSASTCQSSCGVSALGVARGASGFTPFCSHHRILAGVEFGEVLAALTMQTSVGRPRAGKWYIVPNSGEGKWPPLVSHRS